MEPRHSRFAFCVCHLSGQIAIGALAERQRLGLFRTTSRAPVWGSVAGRRTRKGASARSISQQGAGASFTLRLCVQASKPLLGPGKRRSRPAPPPTPLQGPLHPSAFRRVAEDQSPSGTWQRSSDPHALTAARSPGVYSRMMLKRVNRQRPRETQMLVRRPLAGIKR